MNAPSRDHSRVDSLAVASGWVAVVLLLINDHYLKFADPSFVTGKLSDIAELFVLPLALSTAVRFATAKSHSIQRRSSLGVYLAVGAAFIAIKVDQGAANWLRVALAPITGGGTAAVADPSDLIALPALLLSFRVYQRTTKPTNSRRSTLAALPLIGLTVFASVANTPGVPPSLQLLADPDVPGRLYAMFVDEDYYGGTYPEGIYRTDDAGKSWVRVGTGGQRFALDRATPGGLFVLNGGTVRAVGTDARNNITTPRASGTQQLYGTRRLFVVAPWPQQDMFTASDDGLMRSQDRGASWALIHSTRQLKDVAAASAESLLYAVADGRALRSTDHGTSWEDLGGFPAAEQVRLGVDPRDDTRLIAATTTGMYLSTDGGRTWTRTWNSKSASGRDAKESIVFDLDHPERVYATLGTGIGLLVSRDRGATWRESELPALSVAVAREGGGARVFIHADYRGVFHESRPWPDLEPWINASAGLPFR